MPKPISYRLKTDWKRESLVICKTCKHFYEYSDGDAPDCALPGKYWMGGPDWNGVCDDWEEGRNETH